MYNGYINMKTFQIATEIKENYPLLASQFDSYENFSRYMVSMGYDQFVDTCLDERALNYVIRQCSIHRGVTINTSVYNLETERTSNE